MITDYKSQSQFNWVGEADLVTGVEGRVDWTHPDLASSPSPLREPIFW